MKVESDLRFDVHVPLAVYFDFDREVVPIVNWPIPCSWAAIAPPKEIIEQFYNHRPVSSFVDVDCINDDSHTEEALVAWSHAIELAVDKAIAVSHKLNPVVHPWPSLHPKFKGRCKSATTIKPSRNGSVREDPTGAFNPDVEVFSTKSRQGFKQVRRLKSFRRALKACSDSGDPVRVHQQQQQLQCEWHVILEAKGFGSRWASWILSYELIPFVLVSLPDFEYLDLCVDITEMYCNLICRQEARSRYQSFRHRIKVDHDDGFLSLSYKIIRVSSSPPLHEVPFQVSTLASLVRSRMGRTLLRLETVVPFTAGCEATFGDAVVRITGQAEENVFFTVQSGQVPSSGTICQESIAMTTGEIHGAFNAFWSKYWLRDQVCETESDEAWKSFVDQVEQSGFPQYPDIHVTL
jgi:hypothetical protein